MWLTVVQLAKKFLALYETKNVHSVFGVELQHTVDLDRRFVWNDGKFLPDYTAWYCTGMRALLLSPWQNQILEEETSTPFNLDPHTSR
jgi:hypothetical protein